MSRKGDYEHQHAGTNTAGSGPVSRLGGKPKQFARSCESSAWVWDHATLLWSVGNDVDFFIELVRKFLISSPRAVASIENSLSANDVNLPAVEAGARALRESLRDLAAKPAAEAASKLENAARLRDMARAQAALRRLQDEINELAPAFDRIGEQLGRSEF